jgi:lysophospholipase L1-like esterase
MKKRLFTLLAVALPFVLLALLEAGLRLTGTAAYPPLFMDVEGVPGWRVQNPEVAARWFRSETSLPTALGDAFPASKPEGGLRFVVQGGSSAAGYPYYYGGSFSRMLDQALEDAFPDRHVDVINTSMAAVNSYALADVAREIVDIQPDAVLIYAGHNEYYGVLGVGSAQALGRHPAFVNLYLSLQRLHTFRLLDQGLSRLAGLFRASAGETAARSTLMERMVGEQVIPFGSDLHLQGIEQFRHNLMNLLDIYGAAGVPVFIATIASNERDQAPFVDAVTAADAYRTEVRRAAAARDTTALSSLIAQEPLGASAWFARGHLALAGPDRNPDQAQSDLVAARDRDALRFRASSEINGIIRTLNGVTVVDAEAALRSASPDGVIGNRHMLEHLHPNIDGTFLVARAFMDALTEAGLAPAVETEAWRAALAVTPVDRRFGELRLMQLMGAWPFQPPGVNAFRDTLTARTFVDTLALALFRRQTGWQQATAEWRMRQRQTGDLDGAIRAARALTLQYPFLPGPAAELGALHATAGRSAEAVRWYERALELEETPALQVALGSALVDLRRTAEAESAFRRALALDASNEDAVVRLVALMTATGRGRDALQTLRAHVDRYPDQTRPRVILERLGGSAPSP